MARPSRYIIAEATPTLDTNIYASGDAMHTADMEFTVTAEPGGTGIIKQVVIVDLDDQGIDAELWLATAPFAATTHTANAAWSLHDTDAANLVLVVHVDGDDYKDGVNNKVAVSQRYPHDYVFKCAADSRVLYGVLVTRGTPTHTASGLRVRLHIDSGD